MRKIGSHSKLYKVGLGRVNACVIGAFLLNALLLPEEVQAAIKAANIQAALDSPEGVVFSAPGNYCGSNDSWAVNTATIPKIPSNIDGKVTWVGKSCLIGAVPSTRGFERYWNLRSRNYFTLTVQGPGTLTFKYRTSLDDYTEAKLVAYLYGGNNATALQVDEYDSPIDETPASTVLPFEVLFEDSGYWSEYSERWGEMVYDLTGDEFWNTATFEIGTDAYTHTITIAIVGSAKYDQYGNLFSSYILDEEYEGYVRENRVYLDAMTWTPEELPDAVILSAETGTTFVDSMTVYVDSDYDLEAFDFYYTTDGTQPSLQSTKISYQEEEVIDDDDWGDDDDNDDDDDDDDDDDGGIVITQDCTLWVRAYETKSSTWVGEAKASYHRVGPTPEVTVSPIQDFSDRTKLEFVARSENTITYYYTLDGTEPTTKSTKSTDGVVTLANSKLVGKTLKVIAVESGGYTSVPADCLLTRAASPTLSWQIDGVPSQETCFAETVQVSASASEEATTLLNPASGWLTASGSVQAVALVEGMLASLPVKQSFVLLDTLLPMTAEALFGIDVDLSGWGFFTLPGEMSLSDRQLLAAFLKPFALERQAFARTLALELGQTYLVWLPSVDFSAALETLRYASGTSVPSTGNDWHLVPSSAQWMWNPLLRGFSPANSTSQAGWKNGD